MISGPASRLVDIGSHGLHLTTLGDAPGPTVVIEQGAGCASAFWMHLAQPIAAFARVVLYDRAGYGRSDSVKGPRSMQDRVDDLACLLDAAEITGPVVLVGHSFGGPLITLFAKSHPGRVAGFVYADAPDLEHIFGPQYQVLTRRLHLPMMRAMIWVSRLGLLSLFPKVRRALLPKNAPPEVAELLAAGQRTSAYVAGADDIRSLHTAPEAVRAAQSPGMFGDRPLAVISHTERFPAPYDALEDGFDESQARLLALSTDSIHAIAEGAGHLVQFDAPDLVVEVIRRVHAAARDGVSVSTGASPLRGAA